MSWRSYLSPLVLFSYPRKSSHPRIVVTERYGTRQLFVDGAPQSSNHYLSNWRALLRRASFRQLPPQSRVLILGLGAVQLVSVIMQKHPGWHLTFVEIDPVVIKVAKDFFGITQSLQLTIIREDAQRFMKKNKSLYYLIIVDLYRGDAVPLFVASKDFLRHLTRSLSPNGQALFNYASHDFDQARFATFEQKLASLFSVVSQQKVWGHMYYLANV